MTRPATSLPRRCPSRRPYPASAPRRAGVGPATLYRRFPAKRDLIEAAFADQRHICHTAVRDALADTDPWRGFRNLVERICELHARSRGFAETFMAAYSEALDFAADRERSLRAVTGLTRRARQAGEPGTGFVVDDLGLMLMAHRGVLDLPPAHRLTASRRFAAYTVEAFRAAPGADPARQPPRPAVLAARWAQAATAVPIATART
ncbi:hypothetical protein SUDANB6_04278 [Streptomyces sp. enrichment culture]